MRLFTVEKFSTSSETILRTKFLENINQIIKAKIHMHHSYVTGELLSYYHDFCNWRLRENKNEFACFAHNFFRFEKYLLMQGFRATSWNTKDFNITGTGSRNINFTNISFETKFFDTLKSYQKILAQ